MWKESETGNVTETGSSKTSEDHWEWYNSTSIPNSSKMAVWCQSENGLIAVNAIQEVLILKEQELCFTFAAGVSCVQTTPTQLAIHMFKQKLSFDIKVDMQIKGMTTSGQHVVIWNGNRVAVYEIGPTLSSKYKHLGGFTTKSESIAIHEQNLYTLEENQIQVRTFQGTVKQTLSFSAQEGPPITMKVGGDYIVCGTENGYLKIWHIGRREAKVHMQPKDLNKIIDNFGEVIEAVTNASGEKVAVYVAQDNLIPDSRLFIIDLNEGNVTQISITDRFITKLFWEPQNSLYLAVETKLVPFEFRMGADDSLPSSEIIEDSSDVGGGASGTATPTPQSTVKKNRKVVMQIASTCDQVVITFFLDSQKGFLVHEQRELDTGFGRGRGSGDEHLVGMEVPYLYFTRNCGQSRMAKKPSLGKIKELQLEQSGVS